jgi:hypothetical protein
MLYRSICDQIFGTKTGKNLIGPGTIRSQHQYQKGSLKNGGIIMTKESKLPKNREDAQCELTQQVRWGQLECAGLNVNQRC